MPGPVSDSNPGPGDNTPYVPPWCYKDNDPPMCSCGHHHGYHNDEGQCNQAHACHCKGYDGAKPKELWE